MKTIKNPGIWKLGISLIPIPLIYLYIILTKSMPMWTFIVGILSVVVYMVLVTYFCIKQKCYAQLIQNYATLIGWCIVFVIQFYYIDIVFSSKG
jgi:hypothetical protein